MRTVRQALRHNDGVFQEFSPIARDGSRKTHLWARFRIEDGLNIFTGYDITDRKAAEEQLRATTLQLQSVLQNALVGIAQVVDGRLVRVNRRLEQLFGFESGTLEGRDVTALLPFRSTRESVLDAMRARLEQAQVYEDEIALIRPDGGQFWCALSVNQIDRNDPANGEIWLVEDVTLRRETEEKLRYLASFDTLTRLPNRVLLHDRLRRALLVANRSERRVAVLFTDLDHFKHVNDSLGHSAGDQLLQEVAQRLTSCVRATDTVARLGGDEFAIVLDGLECVPDALAVAKKIIHTLVSPYDLDGHEVTISPSIGIAIYPDDGREIDVLLRNADAAMYHAKQGGRSAYRLYTPDMSVASSVQVRFAASLRRALDNNEFFLEYQPQIDIVSGRIVAAEALLRWNSAEHGRVPPDQFIPVLEENGLIGAVGDWVLRQALSEARVLLDRGVCVAVNISGRQFRDEQLGDRIAALLQSTGVRPELLELEITETVVMSDTDVALRTLERLNALGVRISIDDFGMGYSSLAYLKRFPIDALKIDRSFIRDIPADADDTAIVEAIIAMSRRLGLQVVAEGVETPAQFDFLRMNQCQRAQGWLFSRASPIADVVAMIEAPSVRDGVRRIGASQVFGRVTPV
jgi:diguanylate cyclase (GGDEF)-like protein/PAS domain S-box-containing protein